MAEVSFNEEPTALSSVATGPSGMAGWMIRKKIAKDEKSANILLVCVVAGGLALAGLLLAFSGAPDTTIGSKEKMRLEASTPLPR